MEAVLSGEKWSVGRNDGQRATPARGAQKTVCVTLLNAHCWSWRLGNDSRCSSEVGTVRKYRVPRVKEGRKSGQLGFMSKNSSTSVGRLNSNVCLEVLRIRLDLRHLTLHYIAFKVVHKRTTSSHS